jgi:8-oxo-dGTP diphosphatase
MLRHIPLLVVCQLDSSNIDLLKTVHKILSFFSNSFAILQLMDDRLLTLKYTICFAIAGSSVLIIRRNKEPYLHMWNGLGGKIEGQESPRDNIIREMYEESDLDLRKVNELRWSGIVTWQSTKKEGVVYGGMYAFIAFVDKKCIFKERETREGLLSWKKLAWVCDKKNKDVAENIPLFLPTMLESKERYEYECTYLFGRLARIQQKELPTSLLTV